jgi:hypothetical protein
MSAVRMAAADYVISYFRRGSHLSSSPWRGDLAAAKRFAYAGIVGRGADECQIRTATLNGALVWQKGRELGGARSAMVEVLRDE